MVLRGSGHCTSSSPLLSCCGGANVNRLQVGHGAVRSHHDVCQSTTSCPQSSRARSRNRAADATGPRRDRLEGMERIRQSENNPTESLEPTPEEEAAGASLPREPAPALVSSRDTAAPPPPPAVQSLIDKHERPAHPGFALSLGVSAAVGPGIAVGAEASIGIVVDLAEGKLSLFTSRGWGTALASGVSAGATGQVSLVRDVGKFWGSGAEHALNLLPVGVARNYSTPEPGGELEPNGFSASAGPSVGADAHYFEGTTKEHIGLSLDDVTRASGLPSPRRFGP